MNLASNAIPRAAPGASFIGRFRVLRELGRGGQGAVYLAEDPDLQRQVAIKALPPTLADSAQHRDRLMAEARIVSALRHPNIVALYEFGEHEGTPFLVFEYVEGESLEGLLRRDGALEAPKAMRLMAQILGAAAHAHERGVLHLDFKPGNIMVGQDGLVKVTDFGVARMLWNPAGPVSELGGTIRYMCPERFSNAQPAPGWDVFALGLIFQEMLTGEPAVKGDSDYSMVYRIVHEALPLPSMVNPRLDRRLDFVVFKALQKDPTKRFPDAHGMRAALNRCRAPAPKEDLSAPHGEKLDATVEFVLRRMRHKGDFPVLTRNISRINRIASSGDVSARDLANEVLKDMTLTQKLLATVNSAFYGLRGGEVTSVSRAILVMGMEQVRAILSSLICAGHMQGGARAGPLRETATQSFTCAVLAKEIAGVAGIVAREEAFIGGMFRRLGKSSVIYYLPEEYQEIESRLASGLDDETLVSREVLGISYETLGQGIAGAWHFPESLVQAMAPLPPGPVPAPSSPRDELWLCAALADELCRAVAVAPAARREAVLKRVAERFAAAFEVDPEGLLVMMASADGLAQKYAALVGMEVRGTEFLRRLKEWTGPEREAQQAQQAAPAESAPAPHGLDAVEDVQTAPPAPRSAAPGLLERLLGWFSAAWRG